MAGVSPITVSRALSYPEKVKEETRARILEAVAQTGYVVNRFASSLRSGRSNVISVFVSSLMNPHFASTMQGILDTVEGSPFQLLFSQTGYSEQLETDVLEAVLPFRPAGVVVTSVIRSEASRDTLRKLGIPVVEMWGYRPDPIDMLLGFSNHEGGRLMGEHFGQKGFRHVAYSGHTTERGRERIDGFREGLAKHGATLELIHPMEGTRRIGDGVEAIRVIRQQLPECDAIFFGTDILAIGAVIGAEEMGLDVPGDLAIAGFGGLDFTSHVKLTTIHVSGYEMGRDAGRMLLKRLSGEPIDESVVLLPIHLEARSTTDRRE